MPFFTGWQPTRLLLSGRAHSDWITRRNVGCERRCPAERDYGRPDVFWPSR